jgi:hypothetical protein
VEPAILKGSEDFPIQLTGNLDAAIRYLRQHKPTPSALWIDALCINQSLAHERIHQVGLMSRIYSIAKQVLIWLGPPCKDSEFTLEALTSGKLYKSDINRFVAAIAHLLGRDWFDRLWVAQELTLSRQDPIIHLGSQTIGWDKFAQSVELVHRLVWNKNIPSHGLYLENLVDTFHLREIDDLLMDDRYHELSDRFPKLESLRKMRASGFTDSSGQCIIHTTYLHATDPLDRVFGLLGFSTFKSKPIIPDYTKTFTEVYVEAAATIIREEIYDYLQLLDQFGQYSRYSNQPMLSWFPDAQETFVKRRRGPPISPTSDDLQAALTETRLSSNISDCRNLRRASQPYHSRTDFGHYRGRGRRHLPGTCSPLCRSSEREI